MYTLVVSALSLPCEHKSVGLLLFSSLLCELRQNVTLPSHAG